MLIKILMVVMVFNIFVDIVVYFLEIFFNVVGSRLFKVFLILKSFIILFLFFVILYVFVVLDVVIKLFILNVRDMLLVEYFIFFFS